MNRTLGNLIAALCGGCFGILIVALTIGGCSCSRKSPTYALECARETRVDFADAPSAYVRVLEIDGHRFAVSRLSSGGIAICEVTDASLIKTNAEASR